MEYYCYEQQYKERTSKNPWLLYQISSQLKIPKQKFFLRGQEYVPCPCCGGHLKVIGSRIRKFINDEAISLKLRIRRLRCSACGRIHHELPDFLVPYKRYSSSCIEAVLDSNGCTAIPADESTLIRWREWFRHFLNYLLGCMEAILIRSGKPSLHKSIQQGDTPADKIKSYVGDASWWLARVVRTLTNLNLWAHTRSAFLTR